jgi:hypothetical protein
VSARRVLHLIRPGTDRADAPPSSSAAEAVVDEEIVPVDEIAADELVDRVFAADLVIVW